MRPVSFPPLSAPIVGLTLLLLSSLLTNTVCLPARVVQSHGSSTNANNVFFVYSGLSQERVAKARHLGSSFRRNFVSSLESGQLRSEEQEVQFYAQQFGKCASMEGDWQEEGIKTSRNRADRAPENSRFEVQRLLQVLNLDAVSARFLLLPVDEREASIRQACAINELKFQCAYGFISSVERMNEHLRQMKQTDGNFKVMAERECPLADRQGRHVNESVYSCVARSASDVLSLCEEPVAQYNSTRRKVNEEIRSKFQSAISAIDLRLLMAGEFGGGGRRPHYEEALDRVLKESELFMHETLTKLVPLEATKCRSFEVLETCILSTIATLCPGDAASITDALRTLLRVGYFSREREDFLHQHLVEAGVEPHSACTHLNN